MGGDGSYADALAMDWGGPLVMDGRSVILQAVRKLQATLRALGQRAGRELSEVDLFLFHQANRNLLRQVAKGLALDEAKVFTNIERVGNTSAASILIAAAEAQEAGLMGPGRRIAMAAFGAGFSCGSALLEAQ
jgi:3-oxoacyl-[acyl-carrier-protein] synthase-3